ncbi:MAG: D-alanyl-D-alanine carboxypeptidase/D-alanyl-D-alanine-endopeptidase [Acidobacteriia bacterium]|nr:D-alanyl-D-alanine carboxypeptidase/D-alanyl-D-alanine-endopeptidase [Terriglobia bacterium]
MSRLAFPGRKARAALLFAAVLVPAFSFPAYAGTTLETIQTKIAQFLKRPGVRSAAWGIEIFDPATNNVVLSVNPDKTFQPASVLKVVTTAAALEKLGPDFRFRTGAYTDGTVLPDGTLAGDVILVGRGDPNLMDPARELLDKPALQELAEKLRDLGVRKIQGNVIGDDSYFEFTTHGKGWSAHDLRSVYGAPINALSINNNVFWVHVRPTKANQLVQVSIDPPTSYFQIRNLGVTGSSRSQRTISARVIPGTTRLVVSGVLPAAHGYSQDILLERPAEAAATLFKEELRKNGIIVSGSVRVNHLGDLSPEVRRNWSLLAEHQSPPLIRALEIINKRSLNLHAEMLLRVLGAEFDGAGTDEAGLRVVKNFLEGAGIRDDDKISLNDGSGLSRDNLVTPRFQTSLLMFLSTRPYFELFLNTLAISGTDGTLKNRLASTPGVIHAKTGTLGDVAALSGYMTTKSGRSLIFSIFANNVRASLSRVRKTIDEICALFVNLY